MCFLLERSTICVIVDASIYIYLREKSGERGIISQRRVLLKLTMPVMVSQQIWALQEGVWMAAIGTSCIGEHILACNGLCMNILLENGLRSSKKVTRYEAPPNDDAACLLDLVSCYCSI